MNDRAKEQKKMQIYGMNPSMNEVLPIYHGTLYEDTVRKESFEVLKEGPSLKVLICLRREDLHTATEAMLQKMLSACGLTAEDVTLVAVTADLPLRIFQQFPTDYVLLFGILPDNQVFRLGRSMNSPFRFHGRKWLLSYTLSEIQKRDALKSELWLQGLKVLFGI